MYITHNIFTILMVCLFISACTNNGNKKRTYKSVAMQNIYISKVDEVELVDFAYIVDDGELPVLKERPKAKLQRFLEGKIRAVGGDGKLKIIIDNAFLRELPVESDAEYQSSYYGVYDIRIKLENLKKGKLSNIELAVHAENFRRIEGNSISDQDKILILEEQINELIYLLDAELNKQIPLYFNDYIVLL